MRRRWLKYGLMSCAALFMVALIIPGVQLYRLFYQPMVTGTAPGPIVRVDKSTSAFSFVRMLKTEHLFEHDRLLRRLIQFQGISTQLKAGVYQVAPGESVAHLLKRVVAGDVLIESFRIIEGTTEKQVSIELQRAPYLTYHETDWSMIAAGFPSAEGLLLADTYDYPAGSESHRLLMRAHANLEHYLDMCWQQRSAGLPYKTSYELLIAASIIEKEASLPAERRLIGGVIVNRLQKNMPLQMDPTVIYALGTQYKGSLMREDLQVDSPYNSYRHRGLPPTPIAMVGKDAIDAAAHPAVTPYLYFVARGDGSHDFSVTYDEQRQAIARYLRKKR